MQVIHLVDVYLKVKINKQYAEPMQFSTLIILQTI